VTPPWGSALPPPPPPDDGPPVAPLDSDDELPGAPLDSDDELPGAPLDSDDELPGAPLDSDDELPVAALDSDDELPVAPLDSDDELPVAALDSDGELLDSDGGLLESVDGPALAVTDDPAADSAVLEFAAVPELPQADASRPMMPTAATPVMDLRNMKALSIRVGVSADDQVIRTPCTDDDPLSVGRHQCWAVTPFALSPWRHRPVAAGERGPNRWWGGGRLVAMSAVMAARAASDQFIRRHHR
jgi:hypothetical protein